MTTNDAPRYGRGHQKASTEEIVSAYRETGSVWATAKRFGMCGQSIWERLRLLGYPMPRRSWTKTEFDELRRLAGHETIGEIARRLGRPYAGVAAKISRLGLANRYGNRGIRKLPRGAGYDKRTILRLTRELANYRGSVKQFCRANGLGIEAFVQAVQRFDLTFWNTYVATHSGLTVTRCNYCNAEFMPMTKKQLSCSRKCRNDHRRDRQYFGGKRHNTIGLAEGICQLCMQKKEKGLSSHHLLGKENDPDNECLIALCQGCHQIVGTLSGRKFIDSSEGWENLIHLCMARRLAERRDKYAGTYVSVDLEYVTLEELMDEGIVEETRRELETEESSRAEIEIEELA